MPEPISSSNGGSFSGADDPTLDAEGLICRSDAPNSSEAALQARVSVQPNPAPSLAVGKLLAAVPAPPSALPPTSGSPSGSTAHNNAERTSERVGIKPYLDAGRVGDTAGLYAGAALLKGRDANSGLDVETLSVSGQVGTQNEFQVGLVRVGRSNSIGSVAIEDLSARVNFGIHNDDGSTGLNLGAQATGVGAETTLGTVESGTIGLSVGVGVGGSLGVRDLDSDGNAELCGKVAIGPLTLGLCVETPL